MSLWLQKLLAPSVRVQHPKFEVWAKRTSLYLVPMVGGEGWVAWFATYPSIQICHATAEGAVQELCRFLFEEGGCHVILKEVIN
ncbi:MAG: hypothetical protein OT477_16115 [Chloroflexi bacterium]|nr:hypothetical protein [Chloroflexota bacterium]